MSISFFSQVCHRTCIRNLKYETSVNRLNQVSSGSWHLQCHSLASLLGSHNCWCPQSNNVLPRKFHCCISCYFRVVYLLSFVKNTTFQKLLMFWRIVVSSNSGLSSRSWGWLKCWELLANDIALSQQCHSQNLKSRS
jgi:hypothetical protein